MARFTTKTISINRYSPDGKSLRVTDAVKLGLEEDLQAFIRVSNSPTLEWHRESQDPENGATVFLDRGQCLELRDYLTAILDATDAS